MQKKNFLAVAGIAALLIATGCGSSPDGEKSSNETSNGASAGATATITGQSSNTSLLESYITKTFGKSKITSLLNDFPAKGATGIEYQPPRKVEQKDATALENMMKKNGFHVESSPEDGAFIVAGYKGTQLIIFTLSIGEAKAGAMVMEVPEDFTFDKE